MTGPKTGGRSNCVVCDVNAKLLKLYDCCSFRYVVDFIDREVPIFIREPILIEFNLIGPLFAAPSFESNVLGQCHDGPLGPYTENSYSLVSWTSACLARPHDVT